MATAFFAPPVRFIQRQRPKAYTTTFPLTENPISEGGVWTRNQSNSWTNVQTASDVAYGTNGANNTYDDSYAYIAQPWSPNVRSTAIIHEDAPTGTAHEVELLFRCKDTATSMRGYEVLLDFSGTVQIVRWNGTLGDFTVLASGSGTCAHGTIFVAEMIGQTIRAYTNGNLEATFTDNTFTDGQPGIAFFKRPTGLNSSLGFQSITIAEVL